VLPARGAAGARGRVGGGVVARSWPAAASVDAAAHAPAGHVGGVRRSPHQGPGPARPRPRDPQYHSRGRARGDGISGLWNAKKKKKKKKSLYRDVYFFCL
jgi:hypothetical protein